MSLRDELQHVLKDVEYSDLVIDKDAEYRGRSGVKISFMLDGDIAFETIITDDLNLSAKSKARLIRKNCTKALQKYKRDGDTGGGV